MQSVEQSNFARWTFGSAQGRQPRAAVPTFELAGVVFPSTFAILDSVGGRGRPPLHGAYSPSMVKNSLALMVLVTNVRCPEGIANL